MKIKVYNETRTPAHYDLIDISEVAELDHIGPLPYWVDTKVGTCYMAVSRKLCWRITLRPTLFIPRGVDLIRWCGDEAADLIKKLPNVKVDKDFEGII